MVMNPGDEHFSIAKRYERPGVECYLRADASMPNRGSIDLGLEDRGGRDASHDAALLHSVAYLAAAAGDARQIAHAIESRVRELWPDRYWFAEVHAPGAGVQRYQIIQPAVVGGFRR